MPLEDFAFTVISSFLGGFLTKIAYDYFTAAELRYVEEYSYPLRTNHSGFITEGLLVPIRVFNPKRKTINNIRVRIDFNSPVQSVNAKTNLADEINCRIENRSVTSTVQRMNQGNFVVFFANVVDIDSNPIKEIAIQSNEARGTKFDYDKMSRLFESINLIIGILIGTALGILIAVISFISTYMSSLRH